MGKLFGTDGIRGKAGEYPMTEEMAERVGRAVAKTFPGSRRAGQRLSSDETPACPGPMLESALVSGICSVGTDVCHHGGDSHSRYRVSGIFGARPGPGSLFRLPTIRMMTTGSRFSTATGTNFPIKNKRKLKTWSWAVTPSASRNQPALAPGQVSDRQSGILKNYISFLNSTLPSEDISHLKD